MMACSSLEFDSLLLGLVRDEKYIPRALYSTLDQYNQSKIDGDIGVGLFWPNLCSATNIAFETMVQSTIFLLVTLPAVSLTAARL